MDTKGMFKTTLTTSSGTKKETWVYMVAGARPEPLLGDHDADDLGVISFHPEGGDPHHNEREKDVRNVSIPARLRKAGKKVITERPPLHRITDRGREEARRIMDRYKGPIFTDRVGKMKMGGG